MKRAKTTGNSEMTMQKKVKKKLKFLIKKVFKEMHFFPDGFLPFSLIILLRLEISEIQSCGRMDDD